MSDSSANKLVEGYDAKPPAAMSGTIQRIITVLATAAISAIVYFILRGVMLP